MLALVLELLRTQGIFTVGYLSNLLLRVQLHQGLKHNVQMMVQALERLGWVLNLQKSALVLIQCLKYLSLIPDNVSGKDTASQKSRPFEALVESLKALEGYLDQDMHDSVREDGICLQGSPLYTVSLHNAAAQYTNSMGQLLGGLGLASAFDSQDQRGCGMVDIHANTGCREILPKKRKVYSTDPSLSDWGGVLANLLIQGSGL